MTRAQGGEVTKEQRDRLRRLIAADHNAGEIGSDEWHELANAAINALPALLDYVDRLERIQSAALRVGVCFGVLDSREGIPRNLDLALQELCKANLGMP